MKKKIKTALSTVILKERGPCTRKLRKGGKRNVETAPERR